LLTLFGIGYFDYNRRTGKFVDPFDIKPVPDWDQRRLRATPTNTLVIELEDVPGQLVFTLFPQDAPKTVHQFQQAVLDEYYIGCGFYRFDAGYIIQGGCHNQSREPLPFLPLEYKRPNIKGAVSMARGSGGPNSASSEFVLQLQDNSKWLGPGGADPAGYAVFMEIQSGWNVIELLMKEKKKNPAYRVKFKRMGFK